MIIMEGMMLAPPERGTIIGRALWKPRYVVLGTGSTLKTQNDLLSQTDTPNKRKGLKSTSSKPNLTNGAQQESKQRELFISVYKAKGDWEFLAQFPVSAFKSCVVKDLAHRKQSPALPTLIFEMKPDTMSEKQRKRRSSRTGGLSAKDQWSNSFLFRSIPEEKHNIFAWQAAVQPMLSIEEPEEEITSPTSPTFNFTNPFATRNSSTSKSKTNQNHQGPTSRPSALISPAPSLHSRRSDLSSQASSQHPSLGFASHAQNYTPTHPTALPSPASTSGYDNQFIEGWTSAQGRSSALSSHTRGSNSIASAIGQTAPIASTPPGPRETILDRAFQLRCIPGSDRLADKEEETGKLSSIARFEALMREHDARKASQNDKQQQDWGLEEESEDSGDEEPTKDDEDDFEMSDPEAEEDEVVMPSPAQQALNYIAGRPTALRTSSSRSRPLSPPPSGPSIPFLNPHAMAALQGHDADPRPRTGTTSSRTGSGRPASMAFPSRSISTSTIPSLVEYANAANHRESHLRRETDASERRRSSTSVKRLSFQEFTKRLSSTSSLLLVQTNQSSGSSAGRESSEYGEYTAAAGGAGTGHDERLGLRGGGAAGNRLEQSQKEKRCGWRGSVGAFGVEGGFL